MLSLKEIEKTYLSNDETPVSAQILSQLKSDPRAGARKLAERLQKRLSRSREEHERLENMLNFERILWRAGIDRIAGVDEVGLGSMAGPVVAAAVVVPPETFIEGVDDSKRLEGHKRELLDAKIRRLASSVSVGVVEPLEIDRLNIFNAGILAMRMAVLGLDEPPHHILVDGRVLPELQQPQNSFKKGDGLNFSIACASIVAKVYRDRIMVEMDRVYPGYSFTENKGYCTATHRKAVRALGACPIHRQSFDCIREIRGEYGKLFYKLRKKIQAAKSVSAIGECESELQRDRPLLSEKENRKLRILLRRAWKRLG